MLWPKGVDTGHHADLVPYRIWTNCRLTELACNRPDRRLPAGIRQAFTDMSVPDGSDVAGRTRYFGFSVFTRTRYQYGSLETKERKKGKEVWEFRYYETDGQGKRQRRAVTVGTRDEYSTETAARKSPEVQAILLRL